jgi:hypothetical protein
MLSKVRKQDAQDGQDIYPVDPASEADLVFLSWRKFIVPRLVKQFF